MSEGSHPFPSRTRKLSPPEPMVLRGKPRGRVGRCRAVPGPSPSGVRRPRGPGRGGRAPEPDARPEPHGGRPESPRGRGQELTGGGWSCGPVRGPHRTPPGSVLDGNAALLVPVIACDRNGFEGFPRGRRHASGTSLRDALRQARRASRTENFRVRRHSIALLDHHSCTVQPPPPRPAGRKGRPVRTWVVAHLCSPATSEEDTVSDGTRKSGLLKRRTILKGSLGVGATSLLRRSSPGRRRPRPRRS